MIAELQRVTKTYGSVVALDDLTFGLKTGPQRTSSIDFATVRFSHRKRAVHRCPDPRATTKLRHLECFLLTHWPGNHVSASYFEEGQRRGGHHWRVGDANIRDIRQRDLPVPLLTYCDLWKAANVDFSLDDHDPAAGPRH